MTNFKLRIASRRSKLAMVQTLWVKDQLERNIPNLEVSIEAMATQGDKILDVALAKIGDKGLFTKELEAQMLLGQADIAVHSLKDLPTNLRKFVGKSFRECTAISACPKSICASSSFVNKPLSPIFAKATSRILSPWVAIASIDTSKLGIFLSSWSLTHKVWTIASLLLLLAILSLKLVIKYYFEFELKIKSSLF